MAQALARTHDDPVVVKYPAAVATLIVSALALGCDAEVERTENFDYAFNDLANPESPNFEFATPEHKSNLTLYLDVDLESHIFVDAKIEFSRIEVGTCVERDTCDTMSWQEVSSAHMLLSDLLGEPGPIDALQLDLGEYDELRFSAASGWVETEGDGWEELTITTQSVAIPLGIELASERRVDVHVLFDAPASIEYDAEDGWTLDPVLTVENVVESTH